MNRFWRKQLPALLLAMIMVIGMMPAALAVEGETAWKTDADNHWHEQVDETGYVTKDDFGAHRFGDVVKTKDPTCFQKGEGYQVCSVCDYQKTVEIDATGKHVASDEWSYNTASHWHACTATEGCPEKLNEASHSFPSGVYEQNDTYHWQNCDICGGESAKEKHVDSNGDGICDVCHRGGMPVTNKVTVTFKNGSATYATQEINKGSKPTKPSNPTMTASNKTYTFKGWVSGSNSKAVYTGQSLVDVAATTVSANTTYSAVYTVKATSQNDTVNVDSDTSGTKIGTDLRSAINSKFSGVTGTSFTTVRFTSLSSSTYGKLYTSSSKGTSVSTSSSYSYSTVSSFYFVPTSKTSFSIAYTATDDSGNSVSGTITLNVDASTSGTTITYTVKAGNEVAFDKSDFQSAYREEYSTGTIKYVRFETSDTLSTSKGTVYYNYDGSGEKAFTNSNIDDYDFYYSSSGDGDYALANLSFAAPKGASSRTVELTYTAYYSSTKYVEGTVKIKVTSGSSGTSGDTITYEVEPGESVAFKKTDFKEVYDAELDGTIRYVEFSTSDTLSTSSGTVYYNYDESGEKAFTKSNIDDYQFYYTSSSYGDYALANLSFAAPKSAGKRTVELDFKIYDSDDDYVSGTVEIKVGEGDSSSKGDITYEVDAGKEKAFSRKDFNNYYQDEKNSSNTIKWVTFSTSSTLNTTNGTVYFDYDGDEEKSFTKSTIDDYKFYYSSASYGDYALEDLSFVAGKSFSNAVELKFKAYYSSSSYAEGTLVIQPKEDTTTAASFYLGDIVYYSTYNASVQIKASDISRFFQSKYPTSTLQSVVLGGVPATGSLYYNYFGVSKYGASKLKLTAANCKQYTLYANPTSASQYALTELLYVPSGSNYCTAIPFTAYGSGSKSASGTILISVTLNTVGEVYGVTPKNTAVNFPASAIFSAVASATGSNLSSIQLLKLPASSVGTVYVGSGTATKANTLTQYGYSSGSHQMGQLRFVPATGYTGSVEIPYVAYNSSGTAIAAGKFCLGVVNNLKKFTDVTSSTWCYKYVVELADSKVIDGYSDGTFKPNNTITYGAALKLVMLAAGYPEQKPTDSNVFSGYLAKARAEGIITRSNVDLTKPITRLQVAQLAAGALKLDTTNLSSVKPFTDTTDASVQALNAAGIVEGYFSGGTSTYKPNNTLTRGQVSAIVWRMRNYKK